MQAAKGIFRTIRTVSRPYLEVFQRRTAAASSSDRRLRRSSKLSLGRPFTLEGSSKTRVDRLRIIPALTWSVGISW